MASPNVLIVIAMAAEAAPTITRLSLTQSTFPVPSLPYQLYKGTYENAEVTLCTLGQSKFGTDNVGTLHAGVALSHLLAASATPYTTILNCGTCGGFIAQGCGIGSVVIPTSSGFHDRRIVIPGTPYEEYGLYKIANTSGAAVKSAVECIEGHCSTGDSLDHVPADHAIMTTHSTAAKDMEFASLSLIAELYSVPIVGVKVVTDLVDGDRPAHEEFMENLGTAAKALQDTIGKVIDAVVKQK
jgi:5'-methylthioadenosine nucleosidase